MIVLPTSFDFLIAIGFPLLVLVYCLSIFQFNREKLAINEAIFPPGHFERDTRVIANPMSVVIVLGSLGLLRIQSAATFFTRISTNLSLCMQLAKLVFCSQRPKRLSRACILEGTHRDSIRPATRRSHGIRFQKH